MLRIAGGSADAGHLYALFCALLALGGVAWLLMCLLYLPMVRFYRRSPLWTLLLPLIALLYLQATLLSAWRHYRGQGGQWKGRSHK